MSESLTITQRRFGIDLTFVFGPTQLDYTYSDPSSERRFSVPYEAINVLQPGGFVDKRNRYPGRFVVGIMLAYIAMAAIGSQLNISSGVIVFAFIAARAGLYYFAHLNGWWATSYTVLPLTPPPPASGNLPVKVIDDKDGPRILAELKARWRDRIRARYGAVNLSNPPQDERNRFAWLREHGVITEEEYDAAIREIDAADFKAIPDLSNLN